MWGLCKPIIYQSIFSFKPEALMHPQRKNINTIQTIDFNNFQISKSLKMLQSLFNCNLQKMIRSNKHLLQQIQQPSKIRIRKDQQIYLHMNLNKIYEQNSNKIVKQCVQRNLIVSESIQNYDKSWKCKNNLPQSAINIEINMQNQRGSFEDTNGKGLPKTLTSLQVKRLGYNGTVSTSQGTRSSSNNLLTLNKQIVSQSRKKTTISEHRRNFSVHNQKQGLIISARDHKNVLQESMLKQQIVYLFHRSNPQKKNPQHPRLTERAKLLCHPHQTISQSHIAQTIRKNTRRKTYCYGNTSQNFKMNFNQALRDRNHVLRDQEEMKKIIKDRIIGVSSKLAIKMLKPQGYKAKKNRYYCLDLTK